MPDYLPTAGQRLLWAFERHHAGQGLLNVTSAYRIRGPLNTWALHAALEDTVRRHEALRTSYRSVRGRLTAAVHDHLPPRFEVRDGIPDDLVSTLAATLREPLDLEDGPVRATLWQDGPEAVFQLTVHHLSTDGWSGGLLARDLASAYRASTAGEPSSACAAGTYSDFAEWQAGRERGPGAAQHREFWRRRLADVPAPALGGHPNGAADGPTVQVAVLDTSFRAGLVALLDREGVSAYVFFLGAFAHVLRRLSGQERFGIASMFAGRARKVDHDTVGYFANLLVLPVDTDPEQDGPATRRLLKKIVFEALIHQEVPFHLVPRPSGAGRLDSVMFQLATGPGYDLDLGPEVTVTQEPAGQPSSRFELELAVHPVSGAGYEATLWWAPDRYNGEFARALLQDFTRECLDAVTRHATPSPTGTSA